ncbi:NACHT, LRR and PYD domains-containing protein 12-like [Chanos chanos]|uniref:NACHT, LRR and PYD domains-containing protein 12-like n=1 Tax=Chanos chanos TaxID=29144 RepID=A0A6J2VL91_CHACN|nr:NACHT, LRR and PYD domains-containing protein 12-like [Chanos chanos]
MSAHEECKEERTVSKISVPGECENESSASKMDLTKKEDIDHQPGSVLPVQQKRSVSPVPSCASMKSNWSMDQPIEFTEGKIPGDSKMQHESSDSQSCVSMKSNWSMDQPIEFTKGKIPGDSKMQHESSDSQSCVSMKSNWSMDQPIEFSKGKIPGDSPMEQVIPDSSQPSGADFPKEFEEKEIPPEHRCESTFPEVDVIRKHKLDTKKKFECICEDLGKQGNPTLVSEIYTEVYFTQGGSKGVSNQCGTSRSTATEEMPIKYNDIFKPLPGQDKCIRTVMTTGVAGIGKTVSVQKFILDWAEGKANQDIHFICPLPFRELNLMKNQKHSLMSLLQCFFMESQAFDFNEKKAVFIFDGLDECRLSLDFQNNEALSDVTESTSVDVLLTNLIKGNLLPSALIWITSRPAAASQIPPQYIHQITEIQGFNDPQKEEYFRKRINDQNLASRIISHMKSLSSLYIMCHLPVFCWISATVLERMLDEAEGKEIPKTLTEMYTHFLLIQSKIIRDKFSESKETYQKMIFKLGHLAFQQLEKGNLIFYEEDLKECGIDVREASVHSGVCTQISREEFCLHQGKVFCFVHLSIQEHLAALYVYLNFINNGKNVLSQTVFSGVEDNIKSTTVYDLHKCAVDQALQSKNGHLDLFLRFLLGLSLDSNQTLLRGLLTQTADSSQSRKSTVEYIKTKIRENPSPEKAINLFHCLNELRDQSLPEEIDKQLASESVFDLKSLNSHLVSLKLLTYEEEPDVFDLQNYTFKLEMIPDEVIMILLQVIHTSRKADLRNVNLTEKSYTRLALVLSSNSSSLKELDLSNSNLQDSGMNLLSVGLNSPHCILEILRMRSCNLTEQSCAVLAIALSSDTSSLIELDLSYNDILDSGVKLLFTVLENPHCKLKALSLTKCSLTENCCASIDLVLSSSNLQELDLSHNEVKDSGVKLLSDRLKNPHCKLEKLRLSNSKLTEESCPALASTLSSNPSCLRELNLSDNNLQDSGVILLCGGLQNPHCKLEILRLSGCNLTKESCDILASVLRTQRSNSSGLKELDLSYNIVRDSGVELLSVGLKSLHCKLETLRLKSCGVTVEGCAYLASALKSNPSHLRELDLSLSSPGGSGLNPLFSLQADPHYRLEKLM